MSVHPVDKWKKVQEYTQEPCPEYISTVTGNGTCWQIINIEYTYALQEMPIKIHCNQNSYKDILRAEK